MIEKKLTKKEKRSLDEINAKYNVLSNRQREIIAERNKALEEFTIRMNSVERMIAALQDQCGHYRKYRSSTPYDSNYFCPDCRKDI